MNNLKKQLGSIASATLPRILTQICRDPDSSEYGSCDRNWWHYKIRDISSIILQQAGYTLFRASELPEYKDQLKALRELAKASCIFWNKQAIRFRAFEEYYPWEEGYPPVAFSTLTVCKLVSENVVSLDLVLPGLKKAAKQLLKRFEAKASNQQLAGTAALCWIKRIAPELINDKTLEEIIVRILESQVEEGWFPEYGGPDLGYLSVSIDCLWDAFDVTDDARFLNSAKRALKFIDIFSYLPTPGLGMHNARNTDYVVPYGIARFLQNEEMQVTASNILNKYFGEMDPSKHFLFAIDDRYYSHYYGYSLYRALRQLNLTEVASATESEARRNTIFLKESGYFLHHSQVTNNSYIFSCNKGGIITMWLDGIQASDYGWIVKSGNTMLVSHWWESFWQAERNENSIVVTGFLTPYKENRSTPVKHGLLRIASFILGHRLIDLLKERLIFKKKTKKQYSFSREIKWTDNNIIILDTIQLPPQSKVNRAARSSKRHVASADSYHIEDLVRVDPRVSILEKREEKNNTLKIQTVYGLK